MSKHNRSSVVVVGFFTLCLATSATIAACSGEPAGSGPEAPAADAASESSTKIDSGGSSSGGNDAGDGGTTDCVTKCFVDHPAGEKRYEAIDVCWEGKCKPSCVDMSGSFDAGEGGADADAGGMLCGTDISSGVDMACDQCTQAFCCPEWQGCFKDEPDCIALNDCLSECP